MLHGTLDEFKGLAGLIQVDEELGLQHVAVGEELADVVAVDLNWLGQLSVQVLDALDPLFDHLHQLKDLVLFALVVCLAVHGGSLMLRAVRVDQKLGLLVEALGHIEGAVLALLILRPLEQLEGLLYAPLRVRRLAIGEDLGHIVQFIAIIKGIPIVKLGSRNHRASCTQTFKWSIEIISHHLLSLGRLTLEKKHDSPEEVGVCLAL